MQSDADMNISYSILMTLKLYLTWVPRFKFIALREKALLARGELGYKSLNDYHDELGHPNMAVTRMTANANNSEKCAKEAFRTLRNTRREIFYRYKFPENEGN